MTEYIVKFSDFGHDMPPEVTQDNLSGWIEAEAFGTPLIRCKDCEKYKTHTKRRGICHEFSDIENGFYVFVDIDGFCYQSEPKEEA